MNQRSRVAVGLGSNLGDRFSFLQKAVFRLGEDLLTNMQCSSVYETPAWGGIAGNAFLNAVVVGETEWKPPAIVSFLKSLERELGRKPAPRYADREIDLDLLVCGNSVWEGEGVKVPHPELAHRDFVLIPLVEAWPDWIHPKLNKSAQVLLSALPHRAGTRVDAPLQITRRFT